MNEWAPEVEELLAALVSAYDSAGLRPKARVGPSVDTRDTPETKRLREDF